MHEETIEEKRRFMEIFKGSFITEKNELVWQKKYNHFFNLDGVETKEDFQVKVLQWMTRPIAKGMKKDAARTALKRINQYLNTNLEKEEVYQLYLEIGEYEEKEKVKKVLKELLFKKEWAKKAIVN